MIKSAYIEILPEKKCILLIGTTFYAMKLFFNIPLTYKEQVEEVINKKIDLSEEQIFTVPLTDNFLVNLLNSQLH